MNVYLWFFVKTQTRTISASCRIVGAGFFFSWVSLISVSKNRVKASILTKIFIFVIFFSPSTAGMGRPISSVRCKFLDILYSFICLEVCKINPLFPWLRFLFLGKSWNCSFLLHYCMHDCFESKKDEHQVLAPLKNVTVLYLMHLIYLQRNSIY